MKKNPNELTIENSALVLIDHQPAILLLTPSIDQALLITMLRVSPGLQRFWECPSC